MIILITSEEIILETSPYKQCDEWKLIQICSAILAHIAALVAEATYSRGDTTAISFINVICAYNYYFSNVVFRCHYILLV